MRGAEWPKSKLPGHKASLDKIVKCLCATGASTKRGCGKAEITEGSTFSKRGGRRGGFSPPLHRSELLELHAGVKPISEARSRRTVQVAQHDHRLARLRIHAENPVHSRSAAPVAVGPRLVPATELESEAVGARGELRTRGPGERLVPQYSVRHQRAAEQQESVVGVFPLCAGLELEVALTVRLHVVLKRLQFQPMGVELRTENVTRVVNWRSAKSRSCFISESIFTAA